MNSRRYGTYFIFALFSILLVSACDAETKWVMQSHESEKYSFTGFLKGIEKFPYTANQSKLSRVKGDSKRLSLGMKKDDVKKIMGKPDSEMLHYRAKQKDKELIYSTWSYYLKRFERELGNSSFDEAVVLHFKSNNEELYWVDADNLEGFKSLGGPNLHPESIITITR